MCKMHIILSIIKKKQSTNLIVFIHNVLLAMVQLLLALSAVTLYGDERQLAIPTNH